MTAAQIAALALAIPVGALGRRFAGGLLSQWLRFDITTQPARIVWGLMLSGLAGLAGAPWWHALAVAPAIWFGSALFGYWGAASVGRDPGRSVLVDELLLLAHGLGAIAFVVAGAVAVGYGADAIIMLASAILCPLAYAAAWRWPLQAPWLGCYHGDPVKGTDPPPTAELLWGSTVGLTLVLMIIHHGGF